jgi:hypothetical protein
MVIKGAGIKLLVIVISSISALPSKLEECSSTLFDVLSVLCPSKVKNVNREQSRSSSRLSCSLLDAY